MTFLRLSADARTISLPTSVDPVNATFSTSGCAVIARARGVAVPGHKLTTHPARRLL